MALADDPISSVQTSAAFFTETVLRDAYDGFIFQAANYEPEEAQSLINFKDLYDSFVHGMSGSLLSFEQNEKGLQNTCSRTSSTTDPRPVETASNFDCRTPDAADLKRSHTGGSNRALKKQCTNEAKKGKIKPPPSKDHQSIAAKNRCERISERLKILQELVPNGSKVDLVTMLEKAISYVKFLQLQVKVLATDEFWPVQGGKAPDISQVREAIDAILLSQKDSNSSSK